MLTFSFEQQLRQEGYPSIAGLDEAGRGPLAGPVVAAAVMFDRVEFPPDLARLNDSKKLTPRQRETLYPTIIDHAAGYGIGIIDHATIDRVNILQASFLAMHEALRQLSRKPDMILVDGNLPLPRYTRPQRSIIDGDTLIASIAAASILAKVTRDRLMNDLHERYPYYHFNKHKGYGTKLHLETLRLYGPCEIHRRSFAPVKQLL